MYFKCDISKITAKELAIVSAIHTLYREQGQFFRVLSLKPMTFDVGGNLTNMQKQRLLVERVPVVLEGYEGKLDGDHLIVSEAKANKSTKGGQ